MYMEGRYQWCPESLRGLNIPLARKVLDQAENEAALNDYTFHMGTWVSRTIDESRDSLGRYTGKSFCKTAACLAGTAFLLDPDTTVKFHGLGDAEILDKNGHEVDSNTGHGAKLFGITEGDAMYLFCNVSTVDAPGELRDLIAEAEKVQYA